MRHESKLAKICVSLSVENWPCFMAFVPVCLAFMPMGWKLRSGKGRHSLPGNDSWQKGATEPYLRQFDAYHCPF